VCVSAAVAHRRRLVGEHVAVLVPGGTHEVDLAETVRLHGPVTHVFDTEVSVE
jgi:diaminopimelate epimerase